MYPYCWQDLTRYKLLIVQTARQYPGNVWLDYDQAFRKDAAATALSDWSKMNLELYNFHLQPPPIPTTHQPLSSSSSPSAHLRYPTTKYCHSWNDSMCRWPFGRCRFLHACEKCNGDHATVNWKALFPLSHSLQKISLNQLSWGIPL